MDCQKLGDVAAQGGADVGEGGVDAGGERLHASGGAESDESDDQSILDQILAFFTAREFLELHIKLDKQVVHLFISVF